MSSLHRIDALAATILNMLQDMLAKANEIKSKHNKTNVTFIESQITDLSDIPSSTVDCVISNCVVNLVPESEKNLVFKEMYRVLKPGGRVAISDILAKKPLPEKLRQNMALYVGCVSGASLVEQYQQYLKEAGFPADSIAIKDDRADLNVYIETNPDGTRTVGGRGGNLCCNPTIATTPAQKTASCCSGNEAEAPSTAAGTTSSCGQGSKTEPDAAVKAAAASSTSCCGGGDPAEQTYAFDEKDLADLQGEDLNNWAGMSTRIHNTLLSCAKHGCVPLGSFKIYAVKS